MKYYYNFILTPDETTPVDPEQMNPDFRMPTDPMYLQDGVYNQRCRYKIINFTMMNMVPSEVAFMEGKTLVVQFRNCPSLNSWNMIRSLENAPNNRRQGLSPVEFHIRIPKLSTLSQNKTNADADDGTVVTPVRPDFGGYNFSQEIIGQPMWGEIPDIQFLVYNSTAVEVNLSNASLEDGRSIEFGFTLECEPISLKL